MLNESSDIDSAAACKISFRKVDSQKLASTLHSIAVRFLFIASGMIPVHANILAERPLGGTETGVVLLAASLAKLGHDVRVVSEYENPPLSNPLYLPAKALGTLVETDVLIAIRQWQVGFNHIKAKHRLFWTGDAYDQPQTLGLGDKRVVAIFDAILAVSHWQAETTSTASGFPRKKFWVIKNGINAELFKVEQERDPFRLVYTSTPYRGLNHLIRLFPHIKEQVPETNLHIFSDYDVYRGADGRMPVGHESSIKQLEQLKQLSQEQAGIYFRGNLKQADLAKELLAASILAYPNTFMETSCISALEAMAAGCVVVTSKRAALTETVGSTGILINGEPGETKYDTAFVDAVCKLLLDTNERATLAAKARAQAMAQSWDSVAVTLLKRIAS